MFGILRRTNRPKTLAAFYHDAFRSKRLSERRRNAFDRTIRFWQKATGDPDFRSLGCQAIKRFSAYLRRDRKVSEMMVAAYLRQLRTLLDHAHEHGLIDVVPRVETLSVDETISGNTSVLEDGAELEVEPRATKIPAFRRIALCLPDILDEPKFVDDAKNDNVRMIKRMAKAQWQTLPEFFESFFRPAKLRNASGKQLRPWQHALRRWKQFTDNPRLKQIEAQTLLVFVRMLLANYHSDSAAEDLARIQEILDLAGPKSRNDLNMPCVLQELPSLLSYVTPSDQSSIEQGQNDVDETTEKSRKEVEDYAPLVECNGLASAFSLDATEANVRRNKALVMAARQSLPQFFEAFYRPARLRSARKPQLSRWQIAMRHWSKLTADPLMNMISPETLNSFIWALREACAPSNAAEHLARIQDVLEFAGPKTRKDFPTLAVLPELPSLVDLYHARRLREGGQPVSGIEPAKTTADSAEDEDQGDDMAIENVHESPPETRAEAPLRKPISATESPKTKRRYAARLQSGPYDRPEPPDPSAYVYESKLWPAVFQTRKKWRTAREDVCIPWQAGPQPGRVRRWVADGQHAKLHLGDWRLYCEGRDSTAFENLDGGWGDNLSPEHAKRRDALRRRSR